MTHAPAPTIGDRLRGALATARIKQADAAAQLRISQSGLSRRLSGWTAWREGEIEQLAELCGVALADLTNDREQVAA